MNVNNVERVKNSLFKSASIGWPLFGERRSTNPYFKIEGEMHNVYVDMPNFLITEFLEELYSLAEKYKGDLKTLYSESIKAKNKINDLLKKIRCDWLIFSIRRQFFSKKPLGVQVKIDWRLFQKFLDEYAEEDTPLEDKYEYLYACRLETAWMREEPQKDLMEKRVKLLSKNSIKEIEEAINSFIEDLSNRRKKYRERLLLRRRIGSLFLAYLPEMILTFEIIRYCLKKGAISTCYREMRKIIESLSWVIVDDILLFRRGSQGFRRFKEFIPPLRIPTKKWYNWAKGEGLIIRSLNELLKPFQLIMGKIEERYHISKKEVEKSFYNNIGYPLFLVLVKSDKVPTGKLRDDISYKAEEVKLFVKENLREVLQQLAHTPPPDEEFIDELVRLLVGDKPFSIRYPSNGFIIQFLGKMSGLNLIEIYERYSYFVHSYDKTWQFYPFSSVLEFKIFKHELTRFIKLITSIIDFYERELLQFK